jgi:tRNA pseudouridine55 synthase
MRPIQSLMPASRPTDSVPTHGVMTEGVVLVDKPAGMTSHDVVSIVRRATGERRIGHGGTLDPFATGLLVLLLGRATRLLPYLAGDPKVYEAAIRFGHETTTDDSTGDPIGHATGHSIGHAADHPTRQSLGDPTDSAPPPTLHRITTTLPILTGLLAQVPPAYSAKQVAGRRAYAAARAGDPLDLAPAQVTVHDWTVGSWDGQTLHATIRCSSGTYIRALARDLGRACGSAAHLAALRRTASGPFHVADAATMDQVRQGEIVVQSPVDRLDGCAPETIDAGAIARVVRGMPVAASSPGVRGALLDADGQLVAIAERDGENWQPRVVLRDA